MEWRTYSAGETDQGLTTAIYSPSDQCILSTKFYIILLLCLAVFSCEQKSEDQVSENFNGDWEFALKGEDWATVNIPHDWSVSFPFDSIKGEGATSYLLGGSLQTLKDGGCNAIRISHNPGSEEFLSLCDEMGFLVGRQSEDQ